MNNSNTAQPTEFRDLNGKVMATALRWLSETSVVRDDETRT